MLRGHRKETFACRSSGWDSCRKVLSSPNKAADPVLSCLAKCVRVCCSSDLGYFSFSGHISNSLFFSASVIESGLGIEASSGHLLNCLISKYVVCCCFGKNTTGWVGYKTQKGGAHSLSSLEHEQALLTVLLQIVES